jgi:endonuclease/exonuclease/phosphatase family metal-dependent hydrolase
LPALDSVTYLDRPDRTIRVAGGVIEVAGRKLVVAPLHLKCCGRMDSPEDLTRLAEVDALHQAIANTCGELKPDGVVVAGDFNLVGSREPLERLMTGLDLDGSPLATIDAYQIDGRSNATWADRNQPFVPGRLDFALLTDSTLEVRGCFVYDAHDLAPRWREVHRTQADDTDLASDHLPLVFDLSWR